MNKKGYTLVEILMVIVIIAILGVSATITLDKVVFNSKEDRYNEMITDIKEGANVYLSVYSTYDSYLYKKNNTSENGLVCTYNNPQTTCRISIKLLQDAFLLDDVLKDPRSNKEINGTNSYIDVIYNHSNNSVTYGEPELGL